MQEKEAIIRIKEHKYIHFKEEFPRAIKITEALGMAIEALEKQIPKKVTYEGFCPNCKTQYPMYPPSLNKYCGNCGQKLDWD